MDRKILHFFPYFLGHSIHKMRAETIGKRMRLNPNKHILAHFLTPARILWDISYCNTNFESGHPSDKSGFILARR